jgi:UMF1 family MFS transporter
MAEISHRKRIWGWFFFDFASQPFHTLLLTFVFGPYFVGVAADFYMGTGQAEIAADARAQTLWSLCLTVTGLIIGFGAPVIGALADTTGKRLPWIIAFSIMYVVGAWGLWWTYPDGTTLWYMLLFFGIGFIGAEYALIFTNSQLPSLGNHEEVGEISGSGFAFGYFGGILSLIIMLLFFMEHPETGKTLIGQNPAFGLDAAKSEGTRFVGPFVALWFIIFMIPYFLWVRDEKTPRQGKGFRDALGLLVKSVKSLRHRLSLSAYLGSSMVYRDALNGLYGFGGTYAKLVLNWDLTSIGIFGIVAAASAALFSWVGGKLDKRLGPRPVIIVAIWSLILVCITIVCMSREQFFGMALPDGSKLPDIVFFGCGVLIGGMGGVLQASSRSLMVRHTDPKMPTESFGLYGLSGRATSFIAPALIGGITAATGSARIGVSPLIGLFLIGLLLLRWVKPQGDSETWSVTSS